MIYSFISDQMSGPECPGPAVQSSHALGKQWVLFKEPFKILLPPPSLFPSFCSFSSTLGCTAARAIHYCVKVLVVRWPGSRAKQLVFISLKGTGELCFKSPVPPDVPWSGEADWPLCVLWHTNVIMSHICRGFPLALSLGVGSPWFQRTQYQ